MRNLAFQQRVIQERDELGAKIKALQIFMRSSLCGALPEDEQNRMQVQLGHMKSYYASLGERILMFEVPE